MIIRRRAAGLLAITQPDHAHLAGVFAEAWGAGPAVDPAGVRKPLLTAARDHDDGWLAWEREPTIDERGRPHDFLTIPMDQRVAIYRRGIALVCAGDLYAGLLTSMHLTRLVAEGLDSLAGPARRTAEPFLAGQVAWEVRARRELGEPLGAEAGYVVLRAVDFLSLLLCMRPAEELAGTSIPPVHVNPGSPARPVRLEISAGRVLLDPYPLTVEPLEASVEGRALPTQTFVSNEVYRSALAAAPAERLTFTLAAPPR